MAGPFQINAGATFRAEFIIQRAAGVPEDLTGATVTSSIELGSGNSRIALDIEIVDAAAGRCRIGAAAQETARWPIRTAIKWDVRVERADGFVFYIPDFGSFTIMAGSPATHG